MRLAAKAVGSAALMIVAIGGNAQAGGFGCHGRAVECYDKVQLPDVYATQSRPVVVRRGYSEVVNIPPVVINRAEKVLLRHGRWYERHVPALYGRRSESVLVAPASRTIETVPAVTRRIEKTVVVKPGSVRWEHRRGLFGREKLCKIATPPVLKTVAHDIVVSPAHRIARDVPAVYKTVARTVLLQPASVSRTYQAPIYTYIVRPAVIQPASQRVITHEPVVGIVQERVKVGGGYVWSRSRPGLFDH
jgi:hypothetical protein